mgnify:CR=1 FL=1
MAEFRTNPDARRTVAVLPNVSIGPFAVFGKTRLCRRSLAGETVAGERTGTAWLLVGGRLAVLHGLGQLLEPTDDLVDLETGELVEPGRGEVIATIGTSPSETWVVLPPIR